MWPYLHFRVVRRLRRLKGWASHHLEAAQAFAGLYVFGKGRQLGLVRRAVIVWSAVVLVSGYGLVSQTAKLRAEYRVPTGVAGGTYAEGVVGAVPGVNPIIFTGGAAADVSKLVFNGLTQYDENGDIVPDLAERWEVSPDGKRYTFYLRQGITWHDGQPFSAKDVEFTLVAIQTPDTRSPLTASWQGVRAEIVNDTTVAYVLPAPYAPFLQLTTTGIIPRHLLEGVEPGLMSQADFNRAPVGTGPFMAEAFDADDSQISLKKNPAYKMGAVQLDRVVFRSYENQQELLAGYVRRQVQGVSRLQPSQLDEAQRYDELQVKELRSTDVVGAFFKTTSPILEDRVVRRALAAATDRGALVRDLFGGKAQLLRGPLLPGVTGYAGSARQPVYDKAAAEQELERAGWKRGADGVRRKADKPLAITMVTEGNSYGEVAKALAAQWEQVGVQVTVRLVEAGELQQDYIRPRKYDVLLYGINLGADPDGYPFWHSSRAGDPGLNLSSYSSKEVDRALESGRTTSDEALRAAKYKAFAAAWVSDNPAVMLYSPNYLYGLDDSVLGAKVKRVVEPSDRLYGIDNWTVKQRLVDRAP